MGFLSGVLGAVKDDEAVKTYDKSTENIEKVIKKLQSSIGSGRTGLVASVTRVKGWLEGYGNKMKELTDAIPNQLDTLKNATIENKIKSLSKSNNNKLETQVADWRQALGEIDDHVNEIINQNISKLDDALKTRINSEIKHIKTSVNMLRHSAKDEDFTWQVKQVDKTLIDEEARIKKDVDDKHRDALATLMANEDILLRKIMDGFPKTRMNLEDGFLEIESSTRTLQYNREGRFRHIQDAAEQIQELINKFDSDYKSEIEKQFHSIKDEMPDITKSKIPKETDKCPLELQVEKISTQLQLVGGKLHTEVYKLEHWNSAAVKVVEDSVRLVHQILGHVKRKQSEYKSPTIFAKAVELYTKTAALLEAYEKAHGGLGQLVENIQLEVGNLKSSIIQDIETIRRNVGEGIGGHIRGIINALLGAAHKAEGSIQYGVGTEGVQALVEAMPSASNALGEIMKKIEINYMDGVVESALHRFYKSLQFTASSGSYDIDNLADGQKLVSNLIDEFKNKATGEPFGGLDQMGDSDPDGAKFHKLMGNYHRETQSGAKLHKAIMNVKGALQNFENGGHVDQQGGGKVTAKKAELGQIVTAIGTELETIAKLVDKTAVDPNAEVDGIQQKLDYLENLISSDAAEGVGVGVEKVQSVDKIRTALRDLHTREFNRADGEIKQAITRVITTINDKLEKYPELVDGKKNTAAAKMQKLKEEIIDTHNGILLSLEDASRTLDAAIMDVHKSSAAAYSRATNVISDFNKQLTQTVRDVFGESQKKVITGKAQLTEAVSTAFSTLTSAVRTLFAEQKKADLQALKGVVEEQMEYVKYHIEEDKKSGVKGMLNKLKDNFVSKMEDVESIDAATSPMTDTEPKYKLGRASKRVNSAFADLVIDLGNQTDFEPVSHVMLPSTDALGNLLRALQKSEHFDHKFSYNLYALKNELNNFTPTKFGERSSPILQAFKDGISGLATELGKAYVNRYSGKTFGELVEHHDTDKAALTKEGRDCAKTCLTLLEILNEDLSYLRDQCKTKWTSKTIYSGSSLGSFLAKCGYQVSKAKQDGELKNRTDFTGSSIHGKLVGSTYGFVYHQKEDTKFQLENLCLHLNNFYQVGHIAASLSTRRPCSIYEMLGWLTSLLHHPVYFELTTNDFADLFDKPKKKAGDNAAVDGITFEEPSSLLLSAYPQNLTPSDLHDAIMHVTSLAPVILTTIVGYGDEYTTYAVDYHSNAAGFAIPSSPSSCLSMLLELMRRLFPVFRFLHSRCSNLASEYGWYHCAYGSDVESAGWQCKDHSKTDVDCLPRSPLMSYLRDTLPGHLPHQLTSVDCKSECKTCPKSTPGMPCITPLGFKGFSGSKRTGKDVSNVLTKFFDKGVASCLLSLSPRPPSSLPEHYAFALSFVKGWSHSGGNGLKNAINESIKSVSMELHESPNKVTDALSNAYGEARGTHKNDSHPQPKNANVSSLSMRSLCNGENHCGPYLSTLYSDTYPYFGNKHCNAYMSWSVYLPWTFWQQLNSLYNAFLQIFCQDWGCTGCLRGDTCKKGTHGMLNPDVPGDGCRCPSIVGCKGVGPTLYQYGFTFQDVHCLISNQTKCFNLRQQLFSVLNSQYFKDLFKECDEFLWIIRQPFSYLVLALWSLSLFYLICVMVGRLDVLHIKSHLRIPSSHKITAQSLLAAAQVGRLAKISYLQP